MTQKDKLKWSYKDSLRDMTSKYNQTVDLLGNFSDDQTISSQLSGFSELQEWEDENPDGENRVGYFVSLYKTDEGIRLRKATSESFIRGVTVSSPAFSSGVFSTMKDESGALLPRFTHVVFAGMVPVIDNGTCTEGGYCLSGEDGTAVPTDNPYGYKVVSRIDSERIFILVSPQAFDLAKLRNETAPQVLIQDEQPVGDRWIWIKPVGTITVKPDPDEPEEPEEPDPDEPGDEPSGEPVLSNFLLTNDVENSEFLLESEGLTSGVLNMVDSEYELSDENFMVEFLD